MYLLTLNAGSSSLKFAIFERQNLTPVLRGLVAMQNNQFVLRCGTEILPLPDCQALSESLAYVLDWLETKGYSPHLLAGIGHRLVHGGTKFIQPTLVTESVMHELEALRALAPLHLPFGLGVLRDTIALQPHLPNIACFDTAFHATQPEFAKRLPLPVAYHEMGYRRYGFHGLSYEHVVRQLPKQTGQPLPHRLLVAHLGAGASMCAIVAGKSVATTMGYSTADGLVMGSRTGSIDPGVLIALMRDKHFDAEQMEDLLYRQSGLLALSGLSSDMQVLEASIKPQAAMAIDYYCYAAARQAGSLIVAMQGVDAIVFTGGIGQNSKTVRGKIMQHLNWLNIPDVNIVEADEEATIATHMESMILSRH